MANKEHYRSRHCVLMEVALAPSPRLFCFQDNGINLLQIPAKDMCQSYIRHPLHKRRAGNISCPQNQQKCQTALRSCEDSETIW